MTQRWYSETWRTALPATAIALFGGLLIGGLTSFGQLVLPPWVNSLSNSAGGWTMFAFLLVWLGRARPLLAALLGLIAFEALSEGYGIVTRWRDIPYSAPFASVWALVGLATGPVLGISASLVRHGSPLWRALGVTPLAAVLLGEGIYGLRAVADTTSPVYWTLEIVLSVLFIVLALVRGRLGWLRSVLVIGVWIAGTAAFSTALLFLA